MIAGQATLDWLAHRAGERRLDKNPFETHIRALDLNRNSEDFESTFGKREIRGFVGFVDLLAFSDRVKGLDAKDVYEYVRPFLAAMTAAVTRNGLGPAMVDKTIGDEVMFVLPESQDHNDPGVLTIGQLLPAILEIRESLGGYPLRMGLSYGDLYVARVGDGGFSELTIFGEAVHLAKRLCDAKALRSRPTAFGMFGVLEREARAIARFDGILGIVAGFASRVGHKVIDVPQEDLKGISKARCALLFPKIEAERPKCEIVEDLG